MPWKKGRTSHGNSIQEKVTESVISGEMKLCGVWCVGK